jgi:O-antigen ligase
MRKINILECLKAACVIILFAWISFFPSPVHARYAVTARIFFVFFLLILLLNKRSRKHLFSFKDWPFWLFLVCMFSGAVSALYSGVGLRTYFSLAPVFLLLFYIGKSIYSSKENRERVCLVICACSSLVVVVAFLELYFGRNILYENFLPNPFYLRYVKHFPRPMSTLFNPVILGSYLLCCLPFNFLLTKNKRLYLRILGIISSLLCVTGLILTYSRGVFLGFVALSLFYMLMRRKKKSVYLFLLCIILLISFCSFAKSPNLSRLGFKKLIFGSGDCMVSDYRFERVSMALRILRDYPLTGIGFNHFRIRFDEYYNGPFKGRIPYEFMIPDNMYLTFLTETGLIGTAGFFIFIIILLKKAFARFAGLSEEAGKHALLAAITALVALLVNMSAYELFYWYNPYLFFCLICGFIQSYDININDNS